MVTGGEDREPDQLPGSLNYTLEQVREGLDGLCDEDISKLIRISRGLAGKAGMDVEDLYQEAVERMLTTRTCKVEVPIFAYVVGVMKSIASDAYRASVKVAQQGKVLAPLPANDGPEARSMDPTPEEALILRRHYEACETRLKALIAGDEQLELLVEGIAEGLRGKELEGFVEVDIKGLATVRKRLARLRSQVMPNDGTAKKAGGGA